MSNDMPQQNMTPFSASTYLLEQVAKQGPVALLLLCGLLGLNHIGNTHLETIDGMWKERHTEQAAMVKGFQETLEVCCREKRTTTEQRANGIAGK